MFKIGDIDLTKEEEELLKNPPKYKIFDILDEDKFNIQMESCVVKAKWESNKIMQFNKEADEDNDTNKPEHYEDLDDEEKREMAEDEGKDREIFDLDTNELNLGKEPVTGSKNNGKVFMPKFLGVEEELNISIRRRKFRKGLVAASIN